MFRSRLRLILLTLVLASLTLWLTHQQSQPERKSIPPKPTPLSYSWQAENTTLWKIDAQPVMDAPQEQTVVFAKHFQYQEQTQRSQFSQPDVFVLTPTLTTHLQSAKGHSENDVLITLQQQVKVTQTAQADQQQRQLTTEVLHYHSTEKRIYTDQPVQVQQDNDRISGTGLNANLQDLQYELQSNVKATYLP